MATHWVSYDTWYRMEGFTQLSWEDGKALNRTTERLHAWGALVYDSHPKGYLIQRDAQHTRIWLTDSGGDLVGAVYATQPIFVDHWRGIHLQGEEVNLITEGVRPLTEEDLEGQFYEPGG